MGLFHDYTDSRRESDINIESRIDHTFTILCVPDEPDADYYEQVINQWKKDILSYYHAEED